jgi:hypothetical protein
MVVDGTPTRIGLAHVSFGGVGRHGIVVAQPGSAQSTARSQSLSRPSLHVASVFSAPVGVQVMQPVVAAQSLSAQSV